MQPPRYNIDCYLTHSKDSCETFTFRFTLPAYMHIRWYIGRLMLIWLSVSVHERPWTLMGVHNARELLWPVVKGHELWVKGHERSWKATSGHKRSWPTFIKAAHQRWWTLMNTIMSSPSYVQPLNVCHSWWSLGRLRRSTGRGRGRRTASGNIPRGAISSWKAIFRIRLWGRLRPRALRKHRDCAQQLD